MPRTPKEKKVVISFTLSVTDGDVVETETKEMTLPVTVASTAKRVLAFFWEAMSSGIDNHLALQLRAQDIAARDAARGKRSKDKPS